MRLAWMGSNSPSWLESKRADVEAVAVVVGPERELGVLDAHCERRQARVGGHEVAESHAIVVGAKNPLERIQRARMRPRFDRELVEEVARLGRLGGHELALLIDDARQHLQHVDGAELAFLRA